MWINEQAGASFALGTSSQNEKIDFDSFGGPSQYSLAPLALASGDNQTYQEDNFPNVLVASDSSLIDVPNPSSNLLPSRNKLTIYTVEAGDTVAGIASQFGISTNTILDANPKAKLGKLVIGQELTILPVTGTLHRAVEGETIESIASLNGSSPEEILQYNNKTEILAGDILIIPGGKLLQAKSGASSNLPSIAGYFTLPAKGKNWSNLHEYNAIDIANSCGTTVSASAEGLIAEARADEGSDGYGEYILIEHPNGTKTRYAHLSKLNVSSGEYVEKGEKIGEIGNTGNSYGTTGCHLHFEVYGARNPFGV